MNALSVIIGLSTFAVLLVGFLPLLGWLNWLIIPFAAIGLVLGFLSRHSAGRNINLTILILAGLRLFIGGGIL